MYSSSIITWPQYGPQNPPLNFDNNSKSPSVISCPQPAKNSIELLHKICDFQSHTVHVHADPSVLWKRGWSPKPLLQGTGDIYTTRERFYYNTKTVLSIVTHWRILRGRFHRPALFDKHSGQQIIMTEISFCTLNDRIFRDWNPSKHANKSYSYCEICSQFTSTESVSSSIQYQNGQEREWSDYLQIQFLPLKFSHPTIIYHYSWATGYNKHHQPIFVRYPPSTAQIKVNLKIQNGRSHMCHYNTNNTGV